LAKPLEEPQGDRSSYDKEFKGLGKKPKSHRRHLRLFKGGTCL